MRKNRWLVLALVAGGAVAAWLGCDRAPQGKKAITLQPTGEPPVRIVSTQPAPTTNPATPVVEKKSYLSVNGQWVEFPEAKLVIKKVDDHVLAFLATKDPPEVLSPKYRGNRFYFELKLDTIDDPRNIGIAEYRYRAASAEPAETPNGIFLDGDRDHLQPNDIFVVFDRDGDQIIAEIRGQFLLFPKGERIGQMIPVMGTLPTRADSK